MALDERGNRMTTPQQALREVDTLTGRDRQLAALKSAETLIADALFRINGAGLLLAVAGISKDGPAIVGLAKARVDIRDAWELVQQLVATAEDHR